jgi:hypothetical protein
VTARRFDAVIFDMDGAVPCAASRHQGFTEADWVLPSLTELEAAACL